MFIDTPCSQLRRSRSFGQLKIPGASLEKWAHGVYSKRISPIGMTMTATSLTTRNVAENKFKYLGGEILKIVFPSIPADYHTRFEALRSWRHVRSLSTDYYAAESAADYHTLTLTAREGYPSGRFIPLIVDALFHDYLDTVRGTDPRAARQRFCDEKLFGFINRFFPEIDRPHQGFQKLVKICRDLWQEDRDMIRPWLKATEVVKDPPAALLESHSAVWQDLLSEVSRAAWSKAPILLTGESGTGKEVVARYIHGQSRRASGPFVPINCGALPETLLESELFGYAKGAFTGAHADKKGLATQADKGTLFLDEIGEASLAAQVKLLRFLQDYTLVPVGGLKPIKVDIRVIAATNINLEEAMLRGTFRPDLLFRLNVFQVGVPPLRERLEDIPGLAAFFLEKYNQENDTKVRGVSAEAMAWMQNYTWPGNVRELENMIHRAVVLAVEGDITPAHLPSRLTDSTKWAKAQTTQIQVKVEELTQALEQSLSRGTDRWGKPRRQAAKLPLEHLVTFFVKIGHQWFQPKDLATFIAEPRRPRRDKMAYLLLKTLLGAGIVDRNPGAAQAVRFVLNSRFKRKPGETLTTEN